ncbi:MAG: chemoreceptor glutamine deamidase CheD [Gammaproteobacteria bacterium]|nr:chemoreceptor glutamine deamidase CheD [Gammaproteobacteria bacterium]
MTIVPPSMYPPLKGFEHINRYWDKARGIYGAKILPGQYYVTLHDELITTVLGSCISACIRDRKLGIGGMNHFMLPSTDDQGMLGAASAAERYGNFAMEHLINHILKNGGRRENLEVKIFGGGKILASMTDVGRKNINFVKTYIQAEGMSLVSEDVGDIFPRKVVFFPSTGKALVKRLRSLHNDTVYAREREYLDGIEKTGTSGDVELF